MTNHGTSAASGALYRKSRFLMVVDSDVDHLSYLSRLLERFNYQFFKAATAEEAIESTTIAVPCLIIVDLHLTDMHGIDLIQRFKLNPNTSHVPVIAHSKHGDLGVKQRCFDVGAIGCLHRPIDAEALYQAVQVAVERNPRRSMRIRTVQPVKVNNIDFGGTDGACTLDLSDSGMYLRNMKPVPVNTTLSLRIGLNNTVVTTEAVVLYTCTGGEGPHHEPGMGLKFVGISQKGQQLIRQFIKDEVMRNITQGNA
jgi:two-component system cell cycle response regulator DivK